MTTIEDEGQGVQVDAEGYLERFDDWSDAIACSLAAREGLKGECPLSNERMEILRFMRGYYLKFNAFPILRALCKNVHQQRDCTYEHFPDPIVAWKIAGLPKPTTEVFANINRRR